MSRTTPDERSDAMRYLCYTLADESIEIPPPRPELFEEMDAFVQEGFDAGVLVATGGLGPTADGKKVTYSGGKFTVTDGPFAEAKEIIGGWALMECNDLDEVLDWTKRFLTIVGEGETRIRQVFGPE
jgi:hypothetical protein